MIRNLTKEKLLSGETVVGCFLKYAEADLAEYLALQGWDFLVFDGEHGTIEPGDLSGLARACELHGVTPIARVPTNLPHTILRFLDTGIHGVHVPWVNSPGEAEAAVRSVKYHPRGVRGLAGNRSGDYGLTEPVDEFMARANRETLTVIHIETIAAVEAIEGYLEVDDLDVLFLGPTDLSQSMGLAGRKGHPDLVAAMDRVAGAVAESDKILGLYAATPEDAAEWVGRGARYVATGMEGFLRAGMAAYIDGVRRL
ncbi:MAG: 2-dehydro-3-deoxyglucarate aldolase [Acidimicrobiia bacterium]|nr:aldolase/citrate lyase family protein [bacterium]MXX02001.1 2-dehydro-3-deoxyglucarate aldolase [Acidimicrobiia bacterium]MDE0673668.1 aldolase/citrate lyase family protein [bacterium]MXX46020.1 2-dehydro-3-deoxyglucarate aldolase [Acidimicrobiia bacterium]MXY74309.1 2-dehydro-3-deoxyglucarate aldolase [Acidimicrobiia bacterium]